MIYRYIFLNLNKYNVLMYNYYTPILINNYDLFIV